MRVRSVRYWPDAKSYRLANGRTLKAHRFCCLGPGDDVVLGTKGRAHARCRNGTAQVLPIYEASDVITIGQRRLPLTVKEIDCEEELTGYHQLEAYHYRGKVLHGRRVPLIVRSEDPLLPRVLGYIELATAFLMNKPRAVLFNDAFTDARRGVAWTSWKKATVRENANLVVRIARTVVSPEFRGLGLARVLVKHATRFARKHWHVAGMKPFFLEITADMLRYVPFVESSGMHYIGDTEGNLRRVNVDMAYILKNFARVRKREILKEESAGIVDLQVFYATQLKRIEREEGVSREHLLNLLVKSPHRLSDDHWTLLHRILRLPKPTFVKGLTTEAERFVKRRIRKLGLATTYPLVAPAHRASRLERAIEVKDCSLTLSGPLIRTRSTRKIQQAFGVSRDMLATTLFSQLTFAVSPGSVVLVCGPSGAGKSTLLSVLTQALQDPKHSARGLRGKISAPMRVKVSTLGPLLNSRPLVNALGTVTFEDAIFALNVSGLAEAHLYVKRYRELSNGQRYRAMVAKLIASDADIWLADEFCATLDPITSNIVSRNLRRCAKALGVTAILAAANWSEFIHELQPDTVVHLRAPWDYRIFTWPEFAAAVKSSEVLGTRFVSKA